MKRCPNCSTNQLEVAVRERRNGKRHFFVVCLRCHMRGPWATTWAESQEVWDKLPRRKFVE